VLESPADGRFRITVRDHGKGIAAQDLARVWEPFFTTGRDQGGSGLGLAVVRNIVTGSFGGTVGIESKPGHGTAVWFEFPAVAPEPAAPAATKQG